MTTSALDDGIVLMLAAEQIRRHEGVRHRVYDDATGEDLRPGSVVCGHPTIGVGRNLLDPGLSDAEIEILLANDLKRPLAAARAFAGGAWASMDASRRAVLVNMAFNLGPARLGTFRRLRAAVAARDWSAAAREMLDSRWARQVGARARELAAIMEHGHDGR